MAINLQTTEKHRDRNNVLRKRGAHGRAIAFMLAFLIAQIAGTVSASAAYDEGQSTRYSDEVIIFCGSGWQANVTYNNPEHTSATVTALRDASCLFGARANFWFQMELTHTPPGGPTYVWQHWDKNPLTNPGCANVNSCSQTLAQTTTQAGFWQLTSWLHFGAAPDGSDWQMSTYSLGWQVSGPGGPFRPAP